MSEEHRFDGEVAVFGAGYVGCVTAVGLARLGRRVRLVEVVEEKVRLLAAGSSPVREPGIDEALGELIASGRLTVGSDAAEALAAARVALVCVGTPPGSDGAADLGQVERVAEQIAAAASGELVVALRSTAPWPRVRDSVLPRLAAAPRAFLRFALNPELLREGTGLADFAAAPYVIAGTDDPVAAAVLRELYRPLGSPFHQVSPGTASLLKYACNYFHALKVGFANEIAGMAPPFEADPVRVMSLLVEDRQLNVSPAYLRPAFAYGGPCLPKDLAALRRTARDGGAESPLADAVEAANARLVDLAEEAVVRMADGPVTLLGLSFKNGTDDLRGSPLVTLAARLLARGVRLTVHDPDVSLARLHGQNLRAALDRLPGLGEAFAADPAQAVAGARLVVAGKTAALAGVAVPPGATVLDLTRTLTAGDGLAVVHLEELAVTPAAVGG